MKLLQMEKRGNDWVRSCGNIYICHQRRERSSKSLSWSEPEAYIYMLLSVRAYRYHIPNLETTAYETRKILSPASFSARCVKSFKLKRDRLRIIWVFAGFLDRSNERPKNEIFGFVRAKNGTRAKKWKTRAIFHAVFDSSSSFFAPKPHGNACYVGSITSRCSGKWARTHPRLFGEDQDRTRETAEIEPTCYAD